VASIATASGLTLPLLAIANGVRHCAVDVASEDGEGAVAGALVSMYVVLTPKSRFSRSARRLAEFNPEPPGDLARSAFAALMKSAKVLIGELETTSRSGVQEPEHRRHVVGLVRDAVFHRLRTMGG
jgi:hypothetical protein